MVHFLEHVAAAWKRFENDSKHALKSLKIRVSCLLDAYNPKEKLV
jgi:hypothetical protein